MADMEETIDIKLEIEPDDEGLFTVYNVFEEPENLIYDKTNDPLLSLTPIVYTMKLDEMKTIKKDLTNLTADKILYMIDCESRPRITAERIQRSSHCENVESFIKVTDVVNRINLKTNHFVSTEVGVYPKTKQEPIEDTLNSTHMLNYEITSLDSVSKENLHTSTAPLLFDVHIENKQNISSMISQNMVSLNKTNGVRSDVNFNTSPLILSNTETPPMSDAHFAIDQEYIEHIKNSSNTRSFNEHKSVLNNVPFTVTSNVYANHAIVTSPSVDFCADVNANKEYRNCFVVLQDIKNVLLGNHTVKLDSHDRIITGVQIKTKKEETQADYVENDFDPAVLSKIVVGHSKKSNAIETSCTKTNKSLGTSELHFKEHEITSETHEINRTSDDSKSSSGRAKRKRKPRIIYEDASSDEDYIPIVNIKKSKSHKLFSHDSSKNISKTAQSNVSKTHLNNVPKITQNNVSEPLQNNVSKKLQTNISNSKSSAVNMIVVSNDISISSYQEKYVIIVLVSKNNIAYVYRVNSTKLVTDYYVTKDCDEYKLASMYPKEEKIVEQYCCWYKREEIISKICSRKNYSYTILKFLKVPHTCHPEECRCCCQIATSQCKQNEKRIVINKYVTVADDWIRGLLNKFESSPEELVSKALTYTPKIIKEKSKVKKSEKYFENYLLCLKHSDHNQTHEMYEIGQNGDVVWSLLLHIEEEVLRIRRKYQHMSIPIRDAELCCWFKREKLINELKMLKASPVALKHIQKAHRCNYKQCSCCCKPLPVTLSGVETLPSVFRHTTAYEKYVQPITIKFSAKSKNAMSKAKNTYDKSERRITNTDASAAAVFMSGCASKDDNTNLSIDILSKFKNLKLGVDSHGKLEVVLSSPAKNLSVAQLKVLSDILTLSSKQIDKLGLSTEEFCNRINSTSENVVHITTAHTPLITTTITPSPVQDHSENDEIEDLGDKNTNEEDDVISISSNQSAVPDETEKLNSNLQSLTQSIEAPKKAFVRIPWLKTNTSKSGSNMFKSLASLMETKTKCYVDSFKSFFNESGSSGIVLPNIDKFTPVLKSVDTLIGKTADHITLTMPIIKETFTLAGSSTDTSIDFPGPSGVSRQNEPEYKNLVPFSNLPVNTFKRKIEDVISHQVEKKIRVKPLSELNAPLVQEHTISGNSQPNPLTTWSAPKVINQETQGNIQQIVQPIVSTAITISPTMQNQTYIVAQNLPVAAPNMKIISPTSVGVKQVIHFNGKPIKVSTKSRTDVNGVHYLTIAPLKGSNTFDTDNTMLTQILKAPKAQPTVTSSGTYLVPPLAPLGGNAPESTTIDSSKIDDLKHSITCNVIQAMK